MTLTQEKLVNSFDGEVIDIESQYDESAVANPRSAASTLAASLSN